MSDTPRVDARLDACALHDWKTSLEGPTIIDIARQLERELTAEKQRSERLEKALAKLVAAADSTDLEARQSYLLVPVSEIESARAALGDSNA